MLINLNLEGRERALLNKAETYRKRILSGIERLCEDGRDRIILKGSMDEIAAHPISSRDALVKLIDVYGMARNAYQSIKQEDLDAKLSIGPQTEYEPVFKNRYNVSSEVMGDIYDAVAGKTFKDITPDYIKQVYKEKITSKREVGHSAIQKYVSVAKEMVIEHLKADGSLDSDLFETLMKGNKIQLKEKFAEAIIDLSKNSKLTSMSDSELDKLVNVELRKLKLSGNSRAEVKTKILDYFVGLVAQEEIPCPGTPVPEKIGQPPYTPNLKLCKKYITEGKKSKLMYEQLAGKEFDDITPEYIKELRKSIGVREAVSDASIIGYLNIALNFLIEHKKVDGVLEPDLFEEVAPRRADARARFAKVIECVKKEHDITKLSEAELKNAVKAKMKELDIKSYNKDLYSGVLSYFEKLKTGGNASNNGRVVSSQNILSVLEGINFEITSSYKNSLEDVISQANKVIEQLKTKKHNEQAELLQFALPRLMDSYGKGNLSISQFAEKINGYANVLGLEKLLLKRVARKEKKEEVKPKTSVFDASRSSPPTVEIPKINWGANIGYTGLPDYPMAVNIHSMKEDAAERHEEKLREYHKSVDKIKFVWVNDFISGIFRIKLNEENTNLVYQAIQSIVPEVRDMEIKERLSEISNILKTNTALQKTFENLGETADKELTVDTILNKWIGIGPENASDMQRKTAKLIISIARVYLNSMGFTTKETENGIEFSGGAQSGC